MLKKGKCVYFHHVRMCVKCVMCTVTISECMCVFMCSVCCCIFVYCEVCNVAMIMCSVTMLVCVYTSVCETFLSPKLRMRLRCSPETASGSSSPVQYHRGAEGSSSTSPCLPHRCACMHVHAHTYL